MKGLTIKNLMNVEISGTGSAFPEKGGRWVSNEDSCIPISRSSVTIMMGAS